MNNIDLNSLFLQRLIVGLFSSGVGIVLISSLLHTQLDLIGRGKLNDISNTLITIAASLTGVTPKSKQNDSIENNSNTSNTSLYVDGNLKTTTQQTTDSTSNEESV